MGNQMGHAHIVKLVALAALIMCSACTDKPMKTATLLTPTAQQATLKWDETVAASTTVRVNNTSLIFMR